MNRRGPARSIGRPAAGVALVLALGAVHTPGATAAPDDNEAIVRDVLQDPSDATPLGPPEAPALDDARVLPPIPSAPRERDAGASQGGEPLVVVEAFAFEGNTVLSDEALAEIAAPWQGRPLDAIDLEGLRDALTAAYVRAGYLTSGAVLPRQALGSPARLVVLLVEGTLGGVEVSGAERVGGDYYASRITRGLSGPLHVPSLEARLRRLQRDPRLDAIHATIRPGAQPGEAILDLAVEERSVVSTAASVHNQLSPSLGEVRLAAGVVHRSLTGVGDSLLVGGDWSEAGGGVEARYQIPLNASDTLAHAVGRYRRFDVSDGIGRALDIESEYWSAELGLYQPIRPLGAWRDWEFGLGLVGELAQSKITFLDDGGERAFALPGAPNGKTRLTTLRVIADAVHRQPGQVVAFRSVASVGVTAFGATRSEGEEPDARFWSWNAQLQAARRVTEFDIELVGRAALQLTNKRVFGLAQFAIGGHPAVRGYRQNRVVRDEGVVGGVEARLPIWRDAIDRRPIVQLAPFVDAGRAWSRHDDSPLSRPETLASVGVGLRAQLGEHATGELYWARPLRDTDHDERSRLQDSGLHFRVSATWP